MWFLLDHAFTSSIHTIRVLKSIRGSSLIHVFTIEHWGSHFQHVHAAIHLCLLFRIYWIGLICSSSNSVHCKAELILHSVPLSYLLPSQRVYYVRLKHNSYSQVRKHWEEDRDGRIMELENSMSKLSDSRVTQP